MDNIGLILNNVAAASTLLFGLLCLIKPEMVARACHFDLKGPRGVAEFRIGFGGFISGLMIYPLYIQSDLVFTVLGLMWLGGAAVRVLSLFIDKPQLDNTYMAVLVFELTHGLMLLA